MTTSIAKFLLLACCCPPLARAWCSDGGIGSRALAPLHANACPRRPVPPWPPSGRRHGAAQGVRLRSRPEEATSEGDGDGGGSGSSEKMTLQKAAKLIPTFWEMAAPYFRESQPGRRLFYGMIALCLLNSAVSVQFSYIGKDFYNALNGKDTEEFYKMMIKFGGALLVGAPVSVLFRFQREQLAVHWREWMTDRTLQLYSSNRVYYSLERDIVGSAEASTELSTQVDGNPPASDESDAGPTAARIDNPDQRLTEDVRTFTAFSLQLFITLVTSVIDLASFSAILYSIQPKLFATIIGYAIFGTVTTSYIGGSLLPLNFDKLRREADLRYLLVRVRENAESIAFYAGEDVETREVSSRLARVIDNKRDINLAQRNLEFFTTSYQYLIQVVPVAVVAPQYFAGTIQLGIITQSVGAFNHILSDLTVIVNQFEQLSSFAAGIERLSSFMESMKAADSTRSNEDGLLALPKVFNTTDSLDASVSKVEGVVTGLKEDPAVSGNIQLNVERMPSSIANGGNALLTTKNLGLVTPDRKRRLIENLDLTVHEGEHLLIVGNSGAGKSSLLRAIAGLWSAGSGSITRVPDDEVYFLPQRPYCPLGSLKDQLLYPSTESLNPGDYPEGHRLSGSHVLRQSLTDQDFLDVLDQVDLRELPRRFGDGDPIKGLNAVLDWSNTLSLGEQQRLAFGRIVVNQPQLVILDEATSALDVVSENKMYTLLRNMAQKDLRRGGSGKKVELSRPGLTFVSVGHRPTLLAYHDVKLRLNGGSDHVLERLEKSVSIPTDITTMQGL